MLKLRTSFQERDLCVHLLSEDFADGGLVVGFGEDAEPAGRETLDGSGPLGAVDERLLSEALSICERISLLCRQLSDLTHRADELFAQLLAETIIVFQLIFKFFNLLLDRHIFGTVRLWTSGSADFDERSRLPLYIHVDDFLFDKLRDESLLFFIAHRLLFGRSGYCQPFEGM